MDSITLHPTRVSLFPNNKRVIIKSFIPLDKNHITSIALRTLKLTEAEIKNELLLIISSFAARHHDLQFHWQQNFERIKSSIFLTSKLLSKSHQLYIGALFSGEYSFESAALFNPSMVLHPDQTGVPKGGLRFILSLRATGEGHVSSIEFRVGVITDTYSMELEEPSFHVVTPALNSNRTYLKRTFVQKINKMGFENACSTQLMNSLGDSFTTIQLEEEIEKLSFDKQPVFQELDHTIKCIRSLSESNYEICFDSKTALSERIIFPISSDESNGMEDARFVRFVREDKSVIYYATYTAYDGRVAFPKLLETSDFLSFHAITLCGDAIQNKGIALFPRLINGNYAMIARQDGENLYIMYSDNLHFWKNSKILRSPHFLWEGFGIGNCGSPLETAEGWLVITHGIGPMRKYCIGAMLLDLDDPSIVLSSLKSPFIIPLENDYQGYVPNVVYSCGSMIYGDRLIIPYGINDTRTTIATVELKELFEALNRDRN